MTGPEHGGFLLWQKYAQLVTIDTRRGGRRVPQFIPWGTFADPTFLFIRTQKTFGELCFREVTTAPISVKSVG